MIDVPPKEWLSTVDAVKTAGFDYFDWLGCVDEIGRRDCFRIVLLVRNLAAKAEPMMLNCWLPRDDPRIDTVRTVYAGAAWHEREIAELFGVEFVGGDSRRLLLNPEFEGTPLRKDEVLAARTGLDWPGAKEPGRPPHRRTGDAWCLPGSRMPRCGAIAMNRSLLLSRRKWPSLLVAGSGGGVREPAGAVTSLDPPDRAGLYVVHDLRARMPELVHQH